MEYDATKAVAYILEKFKEQGDFPDIMDEDTLSRMIGAAATYDEVFINETGADNGEVYDDDAAFEYLQNRLADQFPDHKMYIMRFVEDYMDYNELYLDSIGAIEWE